MFLEQRFPEPALCPVSKVLAVLEIQAQEDEKNCRRRELGDDANQHLKNITFFTDLCGRLTDTCIFY